MLSKLCRLFGKLPGMARKLYRPFRQLSGLIAELADHSCQLSGMAGELYRCFRQLADLPGELAEHSGEFAGMAGKLAEMPGELARQIGEWVYWVNELAKSTGKMMRKELVFAGSNKELPVVLLKMSLYFSELGSVVCQLI